VPALVEALKDDRSRAAFVACLALVEVGDSTAVPALIEQLNHKDPFNQLAAALSLAFFGNDSGFERLESALEVPEGADWQSFAAVMGLVRLDSDRARTVFADVETDPSTAFGRMIARARVESGVAVFVPCLLEDNREYRLYTVHALRLFDDPAGIGALRVVLNDPDEEVRDMARLTHRRLLRRHAAP
jgi:HEAT repeat protein